MFKFVTDMMDFHKKFGLGLELTPKPNISYQLRAYRIARIREEADELVDAIKYGDPIKIAREGVDLIMVTIGIFLVMGLPLPSIWNAVHRANMAKEAVLNEQMVTKPVKPEGWVSPDAEISTAIDEATADPANAPPPEEPVLATTAPPEGMRFTGSAPINPAPFLNPAEQVVADAVAKAEGNSGAPLPAPAGVAADAPKP